MEISHLKFYFRFYLFTKQIFLSIAFSQLNLIPNQMMVHLKNAQMKKYQKQEKTKKKKSETHENQHFVFSQIK